MFANRYAGTCSACGCKVAAGKGVLEAHKTHRHGRRPGKRWVLWCQNCYRNSDHSGVEDRECGDRAYEDACARACGL